MTARIRVPSSSPAKLRTLVLVILWSVVPALLVGCVSSPPDGSAPQAGIVRMLPDRSLEVRLLADEHGGRVDGVRIVAPEHRDYAAILEGTGPMVPGDQRPYRAAVRDE